MNTKEWTKFARHVIPGITPVRLQGGSHIDDSSFDGIVLETLPYCQIDFGIDETHLEELKIVWMLTPDAKLFPIRWLYFYIPEWDGWYGMIDIVMGD